MPKSSPFTLEQRITIEKDYIVLKSIIEVRRKFARDNGIEKYPRKLPPESAFRRVVANFDKTGSVNNQTPPGQQKFQRIDENVQQVRQMLRSKDGLSVRYIADHLDLSYGTVWRILRKDLHFYAYKPKLVVPLTDSHKSLRVEFCNWMLAQSVK